MPLYRISRKGAAPFLTWGKSPGDVARWTAEVLHGPTALARQLDGEPGAVSTYQAFVAAHDPRVVEPLGEPFTVVEDEPC